jgi:threonine/homoserine/homoserine lactone efflux protein
MIKDGIKFGILVHLAIEPMCLMVFKTANSRGLFMGLILAASETIVDSLYILLAVYSTAIILKNEKTRKIVKLLGFLILMFFGINTLLEGFEHPILPELSLFDISFTNNIFLQGILLAASNPFEILFWGSIFSVKTIGNNLNKFQITQFAFGCLISTFIFLGSIAVLGSLVNVFLPEVVTKILNIIIGIALVIFGIRMIVAKS